jgi:hypothetical protein
MYTQQEIPGAPELATIVAELAMLFAHTIPDGTQQILVIRKDALMTMRVWR